MGTLPLRNVPDDVVDRLKSLAKREGLSVSAMAVRKSAESSCRACNGALLESLPDIEIPVPEVLAALEEAHSAG